MHIRAMLLTFVATCCSVHTWRQLLCVIKMKLLLDKYYIDGSCRRLCSANINSRGSAARSLKSTTVKLSDNKMFHALEWHLLSSTNRPYNGASRCCSGQVSTSVNSCSIGNASGEIAGNVLPSLTCTNLSGKQSHTLGEPTSGQRIKSIAGTTRLNSR